MAFSEPTDSDLVSLLQCPFQAQDGYNLVRRSTMGLSQLFTEISAAKSFGGSVSQFSSNNTDSTGRLNIGACNPTILKRYKLHEIIGEGTFCQIYRATDVYLDKHVAIKILRIGYHILGIREVIFLRYFNSIESRGSQHCKRMMTYIFGYEINKNCKRCIQCVELGYLISLTSALFCFK